MKVRAKSSTKPKGFRAKVRAALVTLERGAYGHGIVELREALKGEA